MKINESKKAFTLLEVLLVVAIIAVLAGIVILAINPTKQLAESRNSQRRADVNTILNAIYQYSLDNNGSLPSSILTGACNTAATHEICTTGGTCTGRTDLSVLTLSEKYLVGMPLDPTGSLTNGTGYYVSRTPNSRVIVCAPSAELTETISVIR